FDALTSAKPGSPRLHTWEDGGWSGAEWDDVVRDSFRLAAGLRELGVERGSHVASVITNTASSVRGLLATWLAGATVASLPVPARGMDLDQYGAQLGRICSGLDSPVFLASAPVADVMPATLREAVGVHAWESLPGGRAVIEPDFPDDDDVAFVQYSSGSTDAPKGCMLTARAIAEQIEIIFGLLEAWPGERVRISSWLPLSHDMGMFGCMLMPWAAGFELYLSSPERFLGKPRSFLTDLADLRADFTAVPSSGLDLSLRAFGSRRVPGDLSALRSIVIGGERIEWRTLETARQQLAPCGYDPRVPQPAYGLAEATLAVTAVPRAEAPAMISLDSTLLADSRVEELEPGHPHATPVVSCGRALRGCRVETVGDTSLASVRVASPSLAAGYQGDRAATDARFRDDGWLETNDLGFVRDGYLYVVGRSDDVITVGGRNVYATEIEAAVAALDPIRPGCCTIVEDPDSARSRLVLLVELRNGDTDASAVAEEAGRISTRKAGITISECIVLARGTMPKTPSGKVQRFRCRQLLSDGDLEAVARVPLRA
ncbi:MAG: AMP-binding protein, partial [Thermoleophilaceae bacterium]